MNRKYHIHTSPQQRGTIRKSPRTLTEKRYHKDNKRKETSSHFLFMMIAEIERTQSNAYQNKDQQVSSLKAYMITFLVGIDT